jgi:hypothetical protein
MGIPRERNILFFHPIVAKWKSFMHVVFEKNQEIIIQAMRCPLHLVINRGLNVQQMMKHLMAISIETMWGHEMEHA